MTTNAIVTDADTVQKAMNPIIKLRHANAVNEFERLAAKIEHAERNGGLDDTPDWQELGNCIRYGGKLAHQDTANAEQMRNALSATQFQLDLLMRDENSNAGGWQQLVNNIRDGDRTARHSDNADDQLRNALTAANDQLTQLLHE